MEDDTSKKDDEITLKPKMSLINGITVIVGSIIGSGIFVSPAGVLKHTGSVNASLIVWTISGVFSMVSFSLIIISLNSILYLFLGYLLNVFIDVFTPSGNHVDPRYVVINFFFKSSNPYGYLNRILTKENVCFHQFYKSSMKRK